MTRSTRSQTNQGRAATTISASPPTKAKDSRKRKRASAHSDNGDLPTTKQIRNASEEWACRDERLEPDKASAILEILEELDVLGLLDRVYPVRYSRQSCILPESSSLRTLLQQSKLATVSAIKAAVEALFPISTHLRHSAPSAADQQRDFCDLALSLLDQATSHVPLHVVDVLQDLKGATSNDEDVERTAPQRRYALVQKLPAGDLWTSVNSSSGQNDSPVKNIITGYAQRVAVLPTLHVQGTSRKSLGSYITTRGSAKAKTPQLSLKALSQGSFLDYGPNTSFAPSWDSEGAELGRDTVGILMKKRGQTLVELEAPSFEKTFLLEDDVISAPKDAPDPEGKEILVTSDRQRIGAYNTAWRSQRLLEVNAVGISRLHFLQNLRLLRGHTSLTSNDELEIDTALSVEETLGNLVSARPREMSNWASHCSLFPSTQTVERLRNSMPASTGDGWRGTLVESRSKALKDDSTVKIKVTQASAPKTAHTPSPAPAVTPASSTSASNVPTTPYRGYSYYSLSSTNGPVTYYPGGYSPSMYPQNQSQTAYPYNQAWAYNYQASVQKSTSSTTAAFPFYPTSSQASQRAVANTAKPTSQLQNGWSPVPLPPHMRRNPNPVNPNPAT